MASATAPAEPSRRRGLRAQLARIRYRLLLVNVIVAAVPLVGISFAELHETQLLGALEDDMIHQAALVRAVVAASPAQPLAAFEPVLAAAAAQTRTRIRLLDAHGAVRADSHRAGPPEGEEPPTPSLLSDAPPHRRTSAPLHRADPPAPLDIASRREVQAALAGRYGSATRLWDHEQRVFLFSALPLRRAPAMADSIDAIPSAVVGSTTPLVVDSTAPAVVEPSPSAVVEPSAVDGVIYVTRSTHDVKRKLYRLRTWLFRVLAATIALTSLVTLILATTIARPLGRLTRRAQRIAARQPVEPDHLATRSDEIGQLARAVEAMTTELERRAHDARTLAADISHEFKTPLTAIRGAAELLCDGATDDPADRDRFLAMILDDAARLDRLVSRLLELARVDDDRSLELPVDLAQLAAACAARTWPVPVTVDLTHPSATHRVSGRRTQLAAALDNLVANATQFATPGTTVRITLEHRPTPGTAASLRLAVTNHGPALSPAARARVWDRFYSTRAASGGSGLGLAIVRSVALGHGGTVGLSCTAGLTTFWLDLRSLA